MVASFMISVFIFVGVSVAVGVDGVSVTPAPTVDVGDDGGSDVGALDAIVETTVARRLERRADDDIVSTELNDVKRQKICSKFQTQRLNSLVTQI